MSKFIFGIRDLRSLHEGNRHQIVYLSPMTIIYSSRLTVTAGTSTDGHLPFQPCCRHIGLGYECLHIRLQHQISNADRHSRRNVRKFHCQLLTKRYSGSFADRVPWGENFEFETSTSSPILDTHSNSRVGMSMSIIDQWFQIHASFVIRNPNPVLSPLSCAYLSGAIENGTWPREDPGSWMILFTWTRIPWAAPVATFGDQPSYHKHCCSPWTIMAMVRIIIKGQVHQFCWL